MTRILCLALLATLVAGALAAQGAPEKQPNNVSKADPVVVEMDIERVLSAETNGVADLFDSVQAGKLVLNYRLLNPGDTDIELAEVVISDQVNCSVVISVAPETTVAAGGETTMVLELEPSEEGPFSFNVNTGLNGEPYSFAVQATVTMLLDHEYHCHTWGCHEHDDHHHHCSTTDDQSWLIVGGLMGVLAVFIVRRVARRKA
jgi:hypothetical protein